jgi:hypothetical protein
MKRRTPEEQKAYSDGFNYAVKLMSRRINDDIKAFVALGKTLGDVAEGQDV